MNFKPAMTWVCALGFAFVAGGLQTAKAAPPTDACSLLTPAQASSVLGVPVSAGKSLLPSSKKSCGWPSYNGAPPPKRVVLTILGPNEFVYMKMPVAIKGVIKTPASGIGDDAVYITTAGLGTGLSFKKGDAAFQVRVYGFPIDQIKAKEKTLALDILAKL
jgi:hypothetical protein